MIISARNNQFDFRFPRPFVPEEVVSKYKGYLNRIPGNMITEPIDFINYGIQSVNLPGVAFDPVEQMAKIGRKRMYRSSVAKEELLSKELNITCQLLDGYINYFMLWDIFFCYYSPSNSENYLPDGMMIQLLDASGDVVVVANMKRVLFTGISALDLNFGSNTQEFNTFELNFVYNELDLEIKVD